MQVVDAGRQQHDVGLARGRVERIAEQLACDDELRRQRLGGLGTGVGCRWLSGSRRPSTRRSRTPRPSSGSRASERRAGQAASERWHCSSIQSLTSFWDSGLPSPEANESPTATMSLSRSVTTCEVVLVAPRASGSSAARASGRAWRAIRPWRSWRCGRPAASGPERLQRPVVVHDRGARAAVVRAAAAGASVELELPARRLRVGGGVCVTDRVPRRRGGVGARGEGSQRGGLGGAACDDGSGSGVGAVGSSGPCAVADDAGRTQLRAAASSSRRGGKANMGEPP